MNKISLLAIGMAAGAALGSCSDDIDKGTLPEQGGTVQFALSAGSRTIYDETDIFQINWTDNDHIRIYCDEAEDVKQSDYKVVKDELTKHKGILQTVTNGLKWGSDNGVHNFYAVYPADDSKVSVSADGIATFAVNLNQVCVVNSTTSDAEGNYVAEPDMTNAYMVAKTSTAPVDRVSLTFRPIMTTLNITVRGAEFVAGGNGKGVTITGISVINENAQSYDAGNGQFKYDITNGTLVQNAASSEKVTETIFVRVKNNDEYYIDLAAGKSVTFTVFLPPISIDAANQVKVRVHATGETTQQVTVGSNTLTIPASSKAQLTLPWFVDGTNNGNNWITPLDDNIYVSQLSIPGTHDAGTGDGTTYGLGQTQELTLDQQFELGIRAFDLRPALNADKEVIICHGLVATKFTWDNIMERFKYYLSTNPGEFIIIFMRHEDEYKTSVLDRYNVNTLGNWQPAMQNKLNIISGTVNPSTGESYCADFRPDLTIGDLRGKILFLCRDWTKYDNAGPTVGGYTGWSHSVDGAEVSIYSRTSSGTLNIQDCYAPSEDGESSISKFPALKWNAIQTLLDKSRTFHTDPGMVNRWSVNHTSGYTGVLSTTDGYRENAANNNVKLYNYLNSPSWVGSTGIVIMDFVGARNSGRYTVYGDLCPQTIIDNNYKYRMKRKGE